MSSWVVSIGLITFVSAVFLTELGLAGTVEKVRSASSRPGLRPLARTSAAAQARSVAEFFPVFFNEAREPDDCLDRPVK